MVKKVEWNSIFVLGFLYIIIASASSAAEINPIVSDDFSAPTLNTSLWTTIDPLNDSTFDIIGTGTKNALLSISVNDSTQHEYLNGYYNAPRIMQNASNGDFELEVKFQSRMTTLNQMEGVIIQQDNNKSIRFTFEKDWLLTDITNIYAVTFDNESYEVIPYPKTYIIGTPSLYMRVKRAGDQWTMNYSSDGINWNTGTTFSYVLTVTSVGPFAGQTGLPYSPPAYTALIDYFFNKDSPIIPEDLSRFKISGYKLNASDNTGIANWNITLINSTMDNTTTFTDANGFYEFTDLVEGTYTVSEEAKKGWLNITNLSEEIAGTDQDIIVNFTNQPIIPTYTVSGRKINESDGIGIPGWNITITNGTITTSTLTNSTGFYEFTNIINGTYTVSEELRSSDWTNITPSSLDIIISGQDEQLVNFRNQPKIHTYNVSGWKINGSDGIGLPGWKITITNGTLTTSAFTDDTGFYNFSDLRNGTYTVSEELQTDWKSITPVSREIIISGNDISDVNFTNVPVVIISDDFSDPALNLSIWTIVNPKNDTTFTMTGTGTRDALLSIEVPNTAHDIWTNVNEAPRIMQKASNKDFEIEVKFQSRMTSQYQIQGVIVQQDSKKFIRFDFENIGSNTTRIFAATFANGIGTAVPGAVKIGGSPSAVPLYMRVKRVGDTWTMKYSLDNITWTQGFNFPYSLTVTSVGPFVGNAGTPTPAYTGLIDYFFNKDSPIDPEDESKYSISGWKINGSDGSGLPGWNITVKNGAIQASTLTNDTGFYEFPYLLNGTYTVSEKLEPEWVNVTPLSREITIDGQGIPNVNFTNKPLVIVSDDFSAPVLKTPLWTKIDPLNDSTFDIIGTGTKNASLSISVPGGIFNPHEYKNGNYNAPRIMQNASNTDFELEVKFQSRMTSDNQMEGVIIQQDSNRSIRFNFEKYSNTNIFAVTFDNESYGVTPVASISGSPESLYMRVKRAGDQWTMKYSLDGTNWTTGATFPYVLTVTSVGPFVGNSGYFTPAYTGLIDYFFNVESPVVPEDISKFRLSGFKLNASDNTGIANWNITISNSTMERNTFTNTSGFYEFTNLVEGTYTVFEEERSGWTNVSTISRDIIGIDQDIREDFTNQPSIYTYNVSGWKINESDGSGLPGWNITLNNSRTEITRTTDGSGFYEFTNVVNGTYTVFEEVRPDWKNVTPVSREITINGLDERVNFTNRPIIPTYNVSGFKINASDNAGLSGWNITIMNSTMQISNLTDVNGFYYFSDLINGTYNVSEEQRPEWRNVSPSLREITIIGNDRQDVNFTNTPLVIVSDDFSAPAINTSVWTFINPKNDTTPAITGTGTRDALLSIPVPDTSEHDILTGINDAPRLMQKASNKDFELEVKFQSVMDSRKQMQGVLVQQDSAKFIRFDFESDGINTKIFAATFNNSIGTPIPFIVIGGSPSAIPMYMRVKRTGDNWAMNYSSDGTNWTAGFTFPYVLNVTSVGLFVGNSGFPTPAFTGLIDYFFNTESPVVPEDAPPAGTKFNVSGFKINASDGTGIANWNITITDGTNTTSTLTGVDGSYHFTNISKGPYTVTEEMQPGWTNLTPASRDITVNYEDITGLNFMNIPLVIESDDFSDPELNTSLWTKIDPVNDSIISIEGTRTSNATLNITIPEGKSHDPFLNGNNNASRIVQSVRDIDFEVEAKFQSVINKNTQIQGILIEQDKKNFTRFEFYSLNNQIYVYKSDIINGISRNGISIPIINASDSPMPLYMRVKRAGNQWTQNYSLDGINWITANNYTRTYPGITPAPLIVTAVGPYIGTAGTFPAFTGTIDYFFNTDARIVPEDVLKFNLSGFKINASDGSGIPGWNITLTKGTDQVNTATNETGFYKFTDLVEGTYTLYEEVRSGWMNITTISRTINGIDQDIREDFTNQPIIPTYNVSGFKINADNGSGIAGWNITLKTGSIQTSTLTGADGSYKFSNIENGTYDVTEETRSGWINTTATSRQVIVSGNDIPDVNFTNKPLLIVSDDFSAPALNTSLWTKIDPVNDSTYTIEGTRTSDALLNITIPEGKSHDPLFNEASRIVQYISDTDFEVVAKFQSVINKNTQIQGILIEQDKKNFTRFEFYSLNNKIFVYKADIINGVSRNSKSTDININASDSPLPLYMSVKRAGNQWTQNYSLDGINWVTANSYNRTYPLTTPAPLVVTAVGPYFGTAGTFPAFTGLVDYFFNKNAPVVPEDPAKLNISGFNIDDNNSNGKWDAGETGLQNWKISLLNVDTDVEIRNTTTDPSGYYGFYDLPAGTYKVKEETKPDYIPTTNTSVVMSISSKDINNLNFTNYLPRIPPNITTQPVDQIVKLGKTATFSVVANSSNNLTYQWQRNGVNISGSAAKNPSYSIQIARMSDNGATFRVLVTNQYGTVISNSSKLTVKNIVSDDFNALAINTSIWTKIDPIGDAKFNLMGTGTQNALLNITIPAGTAHNVWRTGGIGGNDAPRIMQTADNSNFEIETKFQSQMTSATQMQGIIIQQDNDNYLRFDFKKDAASTNVFAAAFSGGLAPVMKINVGITPNSESLYMRINRTGDTWKQFYSTDGTNWTLAGSFNHTMIVYMVGPFIGNSGTPAPAFTGLVDYFFNTSSPSVPEDEIDVTPPNITLWYGNSQRFGHIDRPQRWVNILGNVNDPTGVASLNYSLNNGSASPLSRGPDGLRLQSAGDFNVEIDHSDFRCGYNDLVISTSDVLGNSRNETVSINYSCNVVLDKNYNINWNNVTNIQDVAQITDGLWIKEANGIRIANIGYDRMITIGNMTWTDYEITAPITLNAPLDSSAKPGGPNFGFGMRWKGHYDSVPPTQPRWYWVPLGSLGVYIWNQTTKDFQLNLVGNNMQMIDYDKSGTHLSVGATYIFKMRAETIVSKTLYSLKVWEQGTSEPPGWTISGYGPAGELKQGSITVTSHYSDVSIGNISIRPGPFPQNGTPMISNVSVDALSHSATVRWTTDRVTTSNLSYGQTTAYGNGTIFDEKQLLVHSITLNNLTEGTLYHYKINATDNGGNSTNTSDLNFTTMKVTKVISDDFHAPTLNTSLWAKIDPKGDATFTLEGNDTANALLNITIPAGTPHDVWRTNGTGGNNAARLMQFVSNDDFEIQTKFQSRMTSAYQMQGIIIEQDSDNYLRFDFVQHPGTLYVYAARFTGGSTPVSYMSGITPPANSVLYMKVNRTGDNWKQSYSYDGTNWIPAANFNHILTVTSVGPFVGNADGTTSPAFTGLFDYFFNANSPIVPEDPIPPTPPTIIVQPVDKTAINGSGTTFNVVAAGSEPLSYQWKKNGMNITNATGPSYATPAVNPSDIGTRFSVYVWNAYGNVTSNEATLSVIEPIDIPWWNTTYNFRVPITVNAASFERIEKPVELSLDFTKMLSDLGQTGTLSENSIRIIETDSLGTVLNDEVQFQFDKDAGFDATTKASGTLVFIMNGTTRANQNRYYQVYYGLTGISYSPLTVTPQVTLTENIMDEGQSSYRVGAVGSTYYFQNEAGGFSSLVDASNNDWINFHPTPANSAGGAYRGIPNVYEGGIFHPGHKNSTSSIVSRGPLKIRVKSVSTNGKWESFWDFYPGYATMTMTRAGGNYWWLYEGTPGGVLEPDKDFMVRSDNKKTLLSEKITEDIPTQEWAYFSDPTVNRSLFVSHHEDDTSMDLYQQMSNLMTVFGFGRDTTLNGLLSGTQHFTMGLMDGTEFTQSSKTIYSAYKDMKITKGVVEQYDNANPPTIITQPVNRYVLPGTPVTFNVSVVGQLPLSYQWKRNGVNISGANSASYTIPSANMSDNGSLFSVVITNAIDSVSSNSAKLTVGTQVVLLDTVYTHTGSAGTGPRAFSFLDLAPGIPDNLVSPINYAGGTLHQRVEVISKPSTLGVLYKYCIFQDQIISERHSCTGGSGALRFTSPGTYTSSMLMTSLYQYSNNDWSKKFLTSMLVVNDINDKPVDDRPEWAGLWVGSPNLALYYPMKVRYTALIVPPGGGEPIWTPMTSPVITSQPANQTFVLGQTAKFSVTATGTAPLYYQWQRNGMNISGAYSSSYTTPPTTEDDNGSTYRVIVTNELGSNTSNDAKLEVSIIPPLPPSLLINPGFESGKTPWSFYTNVAGPTFNTGPTGYEGNNAANIVFSKVGTNMQLFQSGIKLEPNTRYRLSFAGKSTLGHDVVVRLFKQVSPYSLYGLDYTADLGTDWAVYTTEFNTTGFTTNVTNGRFQFFFSTFAKAGDTYNIDYVILEKVIAAPPAPPAVIGNAPNGTNVPVTAVISVNFSKPMNQASVQSAFSTSPATTGGFSWSGNNVTYTPANLNYSTTYNVIVGTAAMDSSGNHLLSAYNWSFTTVQDTVNPEVTGNTPTGTNEPVTARVTVTFSEAMNISSAESAFSTIPATNGSFSWSGRIMTYTPDSNLTYNTTYNVTVGTGAMDIAGNSLSVPYEWNFTTMAPDLTNPMVIGNSPTGTNVSLAAMISVNFSEAMDKASVQSSFSTTPATNGSFSWNGNSMIYAPVNLSYNTTYNVTVGTGAMDIAGNNLLVQFNGDFTTVPDTTPPGVIGKSPTGSNAPLSSQITVTFSESMNTTSVESAFSTSPATTGSFSWNGNTVKYIPASNLNYGTTYSVTVGSDARDLAGNNMLTHTWQFTTENKAVTNLVLNPGFESGKTSWSFYTNVAGPTFNVATPGYEGNYSAKLTFSKVGTNMQFYQSSVPLEPRTRYRLSFTAKSSLGHDIRVRLLKQVSPYTLYGLDYTANLGTDWAVFTTEFNTTGFTANVSDARLQFYLLPYAQVGDTYDMDNVVLEKVIAAPPAVIGNAPTGTNVPVTASISVNFSEPMDQASVQSAFSTSPATTGGFSWSGNNMIYTPANLNYSTTYNVIVGTGARDSSGINMLSAYNWLFTTAPDTTNPEVIGKTPTGTNEPVTARVTVTFSKAMNTSSAESAFSTSPGTNGTFSWSGNVMTYTPDSNLSHSTKYTATVGSGAKDLAGNNMQLPYSWNFTTLTLDTTTPVIIGKSPTGINEQVTTQIIVLFSESMNSSSVESAFSTSPNTSGSFGWSGNVMTYTPTSNLEYSTTYTVTVGTGARDLSDNNMQSSFEWPFTTVPDPAPLSVLGATPDGIDVQATTQLTVTFSKAMNRSSAESAFSTSPDTNGTFSWSGNTMTYTPDPVLDNGTTYTATVGTGAKDLAGNSLPLPYNWNFTTLTPDITPPSVSGNTPTGTNVSLTAKIAVTFSEAMNTSSAQSAFSTSPATTGSFSWNANTMTYTPGSNLEFGTTYNITVGTDAKDLAGNNMSYPYENNFTTVYPDTTGPEVIGKSPPSGGSGVPVTAKIIVNFSEAMNRSSVVSAFITVPATTGSFSWSGNNMTYTPSNLNYNTLYNVIIANTAKDLAGNTMLSIGWSFTTIPDTTSPAIIDKTPTGSDIPITSAITVTFNESMNTASVESAFSTFPATTGSFSWNGNKLTFIPGSSLSYGTIYNVTIGSGAMDLAGNNMPEYTWQFTTAIKTLENLVQNPGFESGKTSWSFYTNVAGPTFNAVTPGYEGSYSGKLTFSKVGTNMQLYQSGVKLEPSTRYRLSFAAKSTLGHDIRVRLIKQVSPYTLYGLDYTANLGTDWAVFTTEFNTTGFTANVSDARLQFYLLPYAQVGDTYDIDNVVLEKAG